MTNKIDLSIIIPCYNSEKFIIKALEQIEKNENITKEIIIIDDGSTDKTIDIIEKYISKNISKNEYIIVSQTNRGVSNARNKGIKLARGEYIYFLDSDDYIDKDALNKMLKYAKEEYLDIVYCGFDYVDLIGNTISRYIDRYKYIDKINNGSQFLKLQLEKKSWICMINAIYNKKLLLENNIIFNEFCKYGEDQEFIMKCIIKSNKIGCIKSSMVYYLKHEQATTNILNNKRLDSFFMWDRIIKYIYSSNLNLDEYIYFINRRRKQIFIAIVNSVIILSKSNGIEIYKYIKNNILQKNILNIIKISKSDGIIERIKIFFIIYMTLIYIYLFKIYYKISNIRRASMKCMKKR